MEYFVIVSKRTQLNLLLKALWKYFPLVCFMWSAQSSLSMVIIGLCSCKTKPWDLETVGWFKRDGHALKRS